MVEHRRQGPGRGPHDAAGRVDPDAEHRVEPLRPGLGIVDDRPVRSDPGNGPTADAGDEPGPGTGIVVHPLGEELGIGNAGHGVAPDERRDVGRQPSTDPGHARRRLERGKHRASLHVEAGAQIREPAEPADRSGRIGQAGREIGRGHQVGHLRGPGAVSIGDEITGPRQVAGALGGHRLAELGPRHGGKRVRLPDSVADDAKEQADEERKGRPHRTVAIATPSGLEPTGK